MSNKKGGSSSGSPLVSGYLLQFGSAKKRAAAPDPVLQDGRINQFTTATALPRIKGTYKVIEFFGEHATLATWTFHDIPSFNCIGYTSKSAGGNVLYTLCANRMATLRFNTDKTKFYFDIEWLKYG